MTKSRRSMLLTASVVAVCSLAGGVFGPSLTGTASAAENDLTTGLRSFTSVYEVVEQNFADKIEPDRAIYKGAIPGMLRTLDPHSNFFDPKDFQLLKEDQRGQYYGVGMQVAPHHSGNTIVVIPFTDSPAYKVGLRAGDLIVRVDDTSTDGKDVSEVADLLKGPKGTSVRVSIKRAGEPENLSFTLVRDEIPRKSVKQAFWLKPGIAYVDVDHFNENTSSELTETLGQLGEKKIEGLVLDLRFNPGGLLGEGVNVADRFLDRGQLIVSHRGRASQERSYRARRGDRGIDYPIVVLVNGSSASASEIVAGALQDHDRGWIVGDNTFGKGLVQTVFQLSEQTGLALTTALYYTPSGRLIQREYHNISFIDYYSRKRDSKQKDQEVRRTDSGRTVYGGGGIAPDEEFKRPDPTRLQRRLMGRHAPLDFAAIKAGERSGKVAPGWEASDAMVEEFHQWLLKNKYEFSEAEFAEVQDWIKQQLTFNTYVINFGIEKAERYDVEVDPAVAKAVDSMPKAKNLMTSSRQVLANQRPEGK